MLPVLFGLFIHRFLTERALELCNRMGSVIIVLFGLKDHPRH